MDKLTAEEAKKIAGDTVNTIKSPNSFGKYAEFSHKLDELFFNQNNVSQSDANDFIRRKASDLELAKYFSYIVVWIDVTLL
ncbi:MAG: hypothetical protein PV340_05030 [Wolbachia sp.]|nr:hypothetical protein [Wolbachia sp.]MDD9336363.1 hypothetical protein [Wolbachia sp.]